MASLNVGSLGEYIREQRRNAQYSLRQLADAAGVSNPYLSQIERGLRKPSADILQQIAKALRISAESLYVQAGILDERDRDALEVHGAILADPTINERQKQVLLQIYESFRKENGFGESAPAQEPAAAAGAGGGSGSGSGATVMEETRDSAPATEAPVARAARKTAKKVAEKVAARGARTPRKPKPHVAGEAAVAPVD
jgi:transcriptional regulator with XRE-family HTH domain